MSVGRVALFTNHYEDEPFFQRPGIRVSVYICASILSDSASLKRSPNLSANKYYYYYYKIQNSCVDTTARSVFYTVRAVL